MTFLQPWLLFALPLLTIPIIIHLVHLRRYRTLPWAAMRFLLAATKMSSGYSKLRQWLILAMRALAIAALVFFTARPLASGIAGWFAGDSDQLVMLVLDRSPSMQQRINGAGQTKLELAVQRFSEWTSAAGPQRLVAFSAGWEKPLEFRDSSQLQGDPNFGPSALAGDIPGCLERAREYLEQNSIARASIWICSDIRESDWKSNESSWPALREGFSRLNTDLRFQLLDLNQTDSNRAIELVEAKEIRGETNQELSLSFRVVQPAGNRNESSEELPVEIQLGDARTVVSVELVNGNGEVKGLRIPLEGLGVSGRDEKPINRWGAIRLPADSNSADNVAYFTSEPPVKRKTVVVSDNPERIEAIALCASIPSDLSMVCEVEQTAFQQLDLVDWSTVSLVVWHEQLPDLQSVPALEQFVHTGGQILFIPPEIPNSNEAFGMRWKKWTDLENPPQGSEPNSGNLNLSRVEQWRNDSMLLGNTMSGSALPLGELGIARVCRLECQGTELASIRGDIPLLVRSDALAESAKGGVYALCTTSASTDSTFAKDGIALYVMIQRLIQAGVSRVGSAKILEASTESIPLLAGSTMLMGEESVLSNTYGEQPGVFQIDNYTIAQNRPESEDDARIVSSESLSSMFGSLRWYRVDAITTDSGLVQEIWRWFVIVMLVALLLEALLSVPTLHRRISSVSVSS